MDWIKPGLDGREVRALAEKHNIDLLTASILTRRNIVDSGEIAFFLENDERFLHNPYLFPDMEKAVERVMSAAEEQEKVIVFGDRDVDGVTATVLMVETLRSAGIEPEWYVPVGNDDYGLNTDVLRAKAQDDFTLVITVDCGISDFKEIELARSLGMDVLVFDHHVPRDGDLPPAYALVNPKISPENGNRETIYPFEGLCAAAVVSKFQWALTLAGSALGNSEFIILIAYTNNDGSITAEAALIKNLLEIKRLKVSSDSTPGAKEEMLNFISSFPIFSYDRNIQDALFSDFFGTAYKIEYQDTADDIRKMFPGFGKKPLEELEKSSRLAKYFPGDRGKLSVLKNLVITILYRSVNSEFDTWRSGLDLVALGTLGDLMPLRNENRILVKLGMARLNASDSIKARRKSLRELLVIKNLVYNTVGTTEAAWQICPMINAAGRMGKADIAVKLMLEENPERIIYYAKELENLNKQRRSLGEKFWNKLYPEAAASKELFDGKMIIVHDNKVPRGITGILASRLNKVFGLPSAVIAVNGSSATGSVRSSKNFNVLEWLSSINDIFEDFGGHKQAGGFRLNPEKIKDLEKQTKNWLYSRKSTPAESGKLTIDAELALESFNNIGSNEYRELIKNLVNNFEPYGEGFPQLVFLTNGADVKDVSLVGKPDNNHLKMKISICGSDWNALWWNGAEHYNSKIRENSKVNLVYRIDRDSWRGDEKLRITVLEAEIAD